MSVFTVTLIIADISTMSHLLVNRALTKIVWGEGTKIFTMDTSTEAIDFSGKGLKAHDVQIVASMLPKCT